MSAASEHRKATALTDAEYHELLDAQGGHCALCPNTPKTRRLHVDHDHRTMRVRGLLCMRCNRAVPYWVNVPWLSRLTVYLHHPTADRIGLAERRGRV